MEQPQININPSGIMHMQMANSLTTHFNFLKTLT